MFFEYDRTFEKHMYVNQKLTEFGVKYVNGTPKVVDNEGTVTPGTDSVVDFIMHKFAAEIIEYDLEDFVLEEGSKTSSSFKVTEIPEEF